MQNWDSLQPAANYEHNWYNTMFQTIKTEPQSGPAPPTTSQLEQYLTMKSQQQQQQSVDMNSLTPSPRADNPHNDGQNSFFDHHHMHHHPLGFNPLTPPGLPNAVLPPMQHYHHAAAAGQSTPSPPDNNNAAAMPISHQTQSLTPRNTPPMDVTPPKSPKTAGYTTEFMEKEHDMMSNSSDDTKFLESEDDDTIRMPIYNSHGKMKNYKCKSCGYMAITKIGFWQHARSHMKPEKILQCHKCPFVTELKHHLEYHIRKHKNLKPFQCDKCSYSCVNKSMLNSHRKSHSSVYQYRCADCDYATKYCHSFKLHLRKYDHKPGMVLDEEGLPNPSIVIDVYGTRRGPKMKSAKASAAASLKVVKTEKLLATQPQPAHHLPASPAKSTTSSTASEQQQHPLLLPPLASILQQGRNMSSFFPYWNLNLQMLAAQQQVLAQLSPRMRHQEMEEMQSSPRGGGFAEETHSDDEYDRIESSEGSSAMDLSQGTPTKVEQRPPMVVLPPPAHMFKMADDEVNTPTISSSSSSRRKGRVLKLDTSALLAATTSSASSSADEMSAAEVAAVALRTTESPSSSSVEEVVVSAATPMSTPTPVAQPAIFECKYCDIYFKDAVLYTIHMGYHSCDDVFKCNMCGEKCDSAIGLFVHMARNAHS